MGPRARRVIGAAGALAALLLVLAALGAILGLFAGSAPADLGVRDGRLRGGDWRPNWISSQVPDSDAHHVAPIAFAGDPAEAWAALERAIAAEPRSRLVRRETGYLHAEFASAAMGFVDDAEFLLDAAGRVIHVRGGARLGIRDFGVNRERLERLRQRLAK